MRLFFILDNCHVSQTRNACAKKVYINQWLEVILPDNKFITIYNFHYFFSHFPITKVITDKKAK